MGKTKILVVEDEIDVQKANEQYLIGQGYEVYCAETVKDAGILFGDMRPDLILLDIMLPDGSGYDFCRMVRKESTVPIIFLTAMGADGNVIDGLALGGDDYIVKPYSLDVMGARVAAQLRRHKVQSGTISLPPLAIDTATNKARLYDKDLDLTQKEFQILVYLAERRGQFVTQAQIYDSIWNAPPDTMKNVVRMHVSRLRKKMEIDSAGSCFELDSTGRGYRFVQTVYPANDFTPEESTVR